MRKSNIAIIFISIILFVSCDYIEILTAKGNIEQKQINTGSIKQVVVDASCKLILTNEQGETINIEGVDYLVEGFSFKNNDGVLKIDHEHHLLQKSKLVEVRIPAQLLNRITVNTPAQVLSEETIHLQNLSLVFNGRAQYSEAWLKIDCNKLHLAAYGYDNMGTFEFSGKAAEASFVLEGTILVEALKLECNKVNVTHKSIDDCMVNVKDRLDVKSYSAGNTYYYGSPEILFEHFDLPDMESSGGVIKLEE